MVPKRGPRRPHDRAVCAAFLFAAAARVSLESLPIGHFPRPDMLRTTLVRWRRDGTLDRLMEAGTQATQATERMEREYQHHLYELWADRQLTGEATDTMPRWTTSDGGGRPQRRGRGVRLTLNPNGRIPGLIRIDVRIAPTSGGKADVPRGLSRARNRRQNF